MRVTTARPDLGGVFGPLSDIRRDADHCLGGQTANTVTIKSAAPRMPNESAVMAAFAPGLG